MSNRTGTNDGDLLAVEEYRWSRVCLNVEEYRWSRVCLNVERGRGKKDKSTEVGII
jgi:hypothetical protein